MSTTTQRDAEVTDHGVGTAEVTGTGHARPRSAGARTLLWVGVTLGVAGMAQVAYQGLDWSTSTTTVSAEDYAAAPVVELVADGDVTVEVGTAGRVEVERTSHSGFQDVRYAVSEDTDRLTVEHTCLGWWKNGVCRTSLTVVVPQGTSVVVRSSSGAVRAEGVGGDLDARSGDGDVTVLRAGGTVTAQTSSGRVMIDGTGSGVTATSGDGDVTVRAARGDVEARTSSGAVLVDGATGDVVVDGGDGDVEARAVDGDATVTTSSGAARASGVQGDVTARSGDGDVVVRGTGAPVALDISTGDGRSTVEAPTDPSAARTVTIRTSSGDVSYLGAE